MNVRGRKNGGSWCLGLASPRVAGRGGSGAGGRPWTSGERSRMFVLVLEGGVKPGEVISHDARGGMIWAEPGFADA
jgi:hypothetical protein